MFLFVGECVYLPVTATIVDSMKITLSKFSEICIIPILSGHKRYSPHWEVVWWISAVCEEKNAKKSNKVDFSITNGKTKTEIQTAIQTAAGDD